LRSDLCFICFLEELKREKTFSPKDNFIAGIVGGILSILFFLIRRKLKG